MLRTATVLLVAAAASGCSMLPSTEYGKPETTKDLVRLAPTLAKTGTMQYRFATAPLSEGTLNACNVCDGLRRKTGGVADFYTDASAKDDRAAGILSHRIQLSLKDGDRVEAQLVGTMLATGRVRVQDFGPLHTQNPSFSSGWQSERLPGQQVRVSGLRCIGRVALMTIETENTLKPTQTVTTTRPVMMLGVGSIAGKRLVRSSSAIRLASKQLVLIRPKFSASGSSNQRKRFDGRCESGADAAVRRDLEKARKLAGP